MDWPNAMVDIRWKAYGVSALVFALDRLTKWIVDSRVSLIDTYRVIPGFFDIVRSQNSGVAFGMFNDSTSEWRTLILVIASIVAVIVVGVMLWNSPRMDKLSLCGLALILGGAAGNVFDRIMWGKVTDFLLLYIRDYQWPAFNMADSAIVIGSGLLVVNLFRSKQQAANVS